MRFSVITTAMSVLAASVALAAAAGAQKLTSAEAAHKLSGTWTLNRELSPGFRAPARPGGPGRGGGARFTIATAFVQGRGRGSGGAGVSDASDLSPAELAAMAAMRELQQLSETIAIQATTDRITFVDARGERQYAINGKNSKIDLAGAEVTTRSRWDGNALKQEFSTPQSKLTQTWEVDSDDRLVLVAKVESLRLMTPDRKAVFERKP